MTKSIFIPNGHPTPTDKKSVFVEHTKNKPTCGEKYEYQTADYSNQQKSAYIVKNN